MQTVRIIVHEPKRFNSGKNLFGTILSERGNTLRVKLSEAIQGNRFKSDLMELTTQNENETFNPLKQYYSVMFNGKLVLENSEAYEELFSGSVTYD